MNEPIQITVVDDLDTLFRLHYGRLVRALTVICGDREMAADAVQEAFVKAHLRWRRLQDYDDPVGWIRRVAINRLRDGHRRNTRKERALDRLRNEATTEGAGSAHDAMMLRGGDADGVMAMLAGLPRQQRICLALFYVDGLPVAEIATALDLSEGAVKFHLHQGREKLRAQHAPEHSNDSLDDSYYDEGHSS
jgi:RNA polymerase sigma-70 factor, ECF subfamily